MSLATHACPCGKCFQNAAGAGHRYGDYCEDIQSRIPFYQSLAQPLIYYTHVEPPGYANKPKEPKKANKNYFMKAFRWYTQERLPQPDDASRRSNMSGFALWLDEKYNEYLQNKRSDECWPVFPKQTNEFRTGYSSNAGEYSKQDKKNKCSKSKSSCKKDRRRVKDKDYKYGHENSHNLEYILKPQDLNCSDSECCTRNRPKSPCQSLKTLISKRSVFRSRSFDGNMNKWHNVKNNFKNTKVVCECGQYENCYNTKAIESPDKYNTLPKEVTKDDWCQCSRFIGVAAATQYHDSEIGYAYQFGGNPHIQQKFLQREHNIDCTCPENGKKNPVQCLCRQEYQVDDNFDKKRLNVGCKCSMVIKKILQRERNIDYICPENDKKSPVQLHREEYQTYTWFANSAEKLKQFGSYRNDKKVCNVPTCDGAVQSSDHSINFENAGLHKHPILLKIV
ncbi:hypothetical protein ACJJTC_010279 [Scirpophaga incertulas]